MQEKDDKKVPPKVPLQSEVQQKMQQAICIMHT